MGKVSHLLSVMGVLAFAASATSKQPLISQACRLGDQPQLHATFDQNLTVVGPSNNSPSDSAPTDQSSGPGGIDPLGKKLFDQLFAFLQQPTDFATYYPAEYAFFYELGVESGFLTDYLAFEPAVYKEAYDSIVASEYGDFFVGITDYKAAVFIDYLYQYLVLGIDPTETEESGPCPLKEQDEFEYQQGYGPPPPNKQPGSGGSGGGGMGGGPSGGMGGPSGGMGGLGGGMGSPPTP